MKKEENKNLDESPTIKKLKALKEKVETQNKDFLDLLSEDVLKTEIKIDLDELYILLSREKFIIHFFPCADFFEILKDAKKIFKTMDLLYLKTGQNSRLETETGGPDGATLKLQHFQNPQIYKKVGQFHDEYVVSLTLPRGRGKSAEIGDWDFETSEAHAQNWLGLFSFNFDFCFWRLRGSGWMQFCEDKDVMLQQLTGRGCSKVVKIENDFFQL